MRWFAPLVVPLLFVGCGADSLVGDGSEESTGTPAPFERCTPDALPEAAMAVVTEDPDAGDGPFAIRISTAFDWCTSSGWWAGWGVDVTFSNGRPEPGEYSLGDDVEPRSGGSYAEGKTESLSSELDGGVLQIVEVEDDGTVHGVLCDVSLTTYDEPKLVQGSFTALPCE